jgi:monoamine oxidase
LKTPVTAQATSQTKQLPPTPAETQKATAAPADTRIERHGEAKRILILGAGLSGLVAGYELMRAGHHVIILEGRMRPGGRVHTLRSPFSDGLIAEAGAGRIPINHEWTYRYIKHFGLTTVPFSPPSLTPLLYIHGKRIRLTSTTRLSEYFDLSSEEQALGLSGMQQRYIVPAIQEILSKSDITATDWPPASLQKFDQHAMPGFLRSLGASQTAADLLFPGALTKTASALIVLRVLAATDLNRLEKIEGGNDLLPKAIAAKLTQQIIYGAQVVRIGEDRSSVNATFLQDGTHHTLQADYLICTIPFSVLRGLESMPNFTPRKQQAIREMTYVSMTKVMLQNETRHWEQQGLSGFVQTDTNSEVWGPSWDQPTQRGILQLYQEGKMADDLDRMAPEERLHSAAVSLKKIFPGLKPDFNKSTSYSWKLDKFSCGAHAEAHPGQLYSWYPSAATVEGRIHFAGEHTSDMPAFMQGAITSGHRAASEVNER